MCATWGAPRKEMSPDSCSLSVFVVHQDMYTLERWNFRRHSDRIEIKSWYSRPPVAPGSKSEVSLIGYVDHGIIRAIHQQAEEKSKQHGFIDKPGFSISKDSYPNLDLQSYPAHKVQFKSGSAGSDQRWTTCRANSNSKNSRLQPWVGSKLRFKLERFDKSSNSYLLFFSVDNVIIKKLCQECAPMHVFDTYAS